jgi:hypothetical protein
MDSDGSRTNAGMARQRNFQAEYERRVVSAARRGLTRSQARGHARNGEPSIRPTSAKDRDRFEAALKLYRQTGNQSAAAKALNLAPERLRRFLRETVQIQGRGRSLKITDNRKREMMVLSNGGAHQIHLRDFEQASLNGRHLATVAKFILSNNRDLLAPFEGRSVIDARGKSHLLETHPNTLHRLHSHGSEIFHEIYTLISNGV